MPSDLLPSEIDRLTEPASISLAARIEHIPIATPLSDRPISTAYVRQSGFQEINLGKESINCTPIVLLHGFDSSVLEFRRLLPLLAEKHEVWAIDLLGFGFTERLAEVPYSTNAIKTHLYSFWQQVIRQPVILVGASMGGAAAIDFTLTYPNAVRKLVLIDTAGYTASAAIGKFLFPPLDRLAVDFLRRPQVRSQISQAAYYDKSFATADANLCAALHLKLPGWHDAIKAFTKSGGYGSFRTRLAQIEPPTLILWGDRDRILGTDVAYKFQRAIVNSQLVWIEQCGHVPHLEKPQATSDCIATFV
jgi:pimeloyl-ACP methyl ester carboxylesterase